MYSTKNIYRDMVENWLRSCFGSPDPKMDQNSDFFNLNSLTYSFKKLLDDSSLWNTGILDPNLSLRVLLFRCNKIVS